MNIDDMDNKDFKVSLRELEKEFLCNVCFNEIEDCYITRCGHVYCKKCVFQTINRHHRCPFCNAQLNQTDVFKNYHFNTLKKIISKEKTQAATVYTDKVFQYQEEAEGVLLAPVEKTLRENYVDTLLTYRKFTKELYQNLQKAEETRALERKANYDIKTPQQLTKEIHQVILPYLSSCLIPPILIPHSFSIHLALNPSKKVTLTITLSALTPVESILNQFQNALKDNNCRFEFREPRLQAKVRINQFQYTLADILGQNVHHMWNKPLYLLLGDGITIARNIECFTYKWFDNKKTNYSTCKTCNINWVCQTCKDYCHEGHVLVDQLKDHTPNWSCCYCVSKSDCRALNKNS